MEVKKYKHADLESKRGLFLQIGFVLALGGAFLAFEWETAPKTVEQWGSVVEEIEAPEMVPIVRIEKEKVLPKLKKLFVPEFLIIIDNSEPDIEEMLDFGEFDESLAIDFATLEVEEETDGDPIPFAFLENQPQFPGGMKGLLTYLAKHVEYPVICLENGIQGTVYISFVIDEQGQVVQVKVARPSDPNLERAAKRVVAGMPSWKPGKQRGRAVKVSYSVPIRFKLAMS